jgi:hypothetical protein
MRWAISFHFFPLSHVACQKGVISVFLNKILVAAQKRPICNSLQGFPSPPRSFHSSHGHLKRRDLAKWSVLRIPTLQDCWVYISFPNSPCIAHWRPTIRRPLNFVDAMCCPGRNNEWDQVVNGLWCEHRLDNRGVPRRCDVLPIPSGNFSRHSSSRCWKSNVRRHRTERGNPRCFGRPSRMSSWLTWPNLIWTTLWMLVQRPVTPQNHEILKWCIGYAASKEPQIVSHHPP